jgi:hypothetical protein
MTTTGGIVKQYGAEVPKATKETTTYHSTQNQSPPRSQFHFDPTVVMRLLVNRRYAMNNAGFPS